MIEPWIKSYLPPHGSLALDVGANVGSYSEWLAERFDDVHAFEPHPDACEKLRQTVPRAKVFECAVGAASGTVDLNIYAESVHTSQFTDADLDTLSRGEPSRTITVPVVTLDDLGYANLPLDFVKIDVEGAECAVLEGAGATLLATMPRMLIEIHSEANGAWCESYLTGLDFDVRRIPHPHHGVPVGHHWLVA